MNSENSEYKKYLDIKLPKSYYQYIDADLSKLDRDHADQLLSINLSSYVACRLENLAVHNSMPVQEVLKKILIKEGILEEDDVSFSGRRKASSKFYGMDCEKLRDIGTSKLYRISLSEYAKAKVLNKMIEIGYDLSFFIKQAMVKKSEKSKEFYHILQLSDIGS